MAKKQTGGAKARFRAIERLASAMPLAKFLKTAKKQNRLSRKERLRIVDQALLLLDMNYVHLPLKRAMHAIDPIRQLKLLKFRLEETKVVLEDENRFHGRLLEIFASLRDLHTVYQLPSVFEDQVAFLPFLIEQYFVSDKASEQTGAYPRNGKTARKGTLSDQPIEKFMISRVAQGYFRSGAKSAEEIASFQPGVEVIFWNGVPIRRAIELNGERQAGSNLPARFARGLDSLTSRPLEWLLPPDESEVSITYRSKSGKILTLANQKWLVGRINTPPSATLTTRKKRAAVDLKKTKINQLKYQLYTQSSQPYARREFRVRKQFENLFHAQARWAEGREIGYVRLYSFNPSDPDLFVSEFKRVIKSKGFPQEGLIIDVRGNGGGLIRAGERLLQLFTPRRITPELFEFLNTPLNLEICKRAPKNWNLARWGRSIAEAVETGSIYSMGFPLNSEESCNDIGQVYHGPVILITDALSYSTTDMFAAGFQDNQVGVVLGTSDNTGAGGANNWTLDDLRTAIGYGRNSPFKLLPKGADMGVAMRRSIRVGQHMGKLLEELGIEPNARHYMTKRDVLVGNVDLINQAVKILNQKPIYSLTVKPFGSAKTRGVIVTATSKSSPGRPSQKISYLDIYANGRFYKTVNAQSGAVTIRTKLPESEEKHEVLIQAFDGAKNLVAAYRYK